jgi:Tetratricopeptide repeat
VLGNPRGVGALEHNRVDRGCEQFGVVDVSALDLQAQGAAGALDEQDDHPTVATWRHNLGSVLLDLGDLAGAKQLYERALAIGDAALGPDHPTVAIYRRNLDGVLQALQKAPPEGSSSSLLCHSCTLANVNVLSLALPLGKLRGRGLARAAGVG